MRMKRKLLWIVIALLLVSNVVTLLILNSGEEENRRMHGGTTEGNQGNQVAATIGGEEISYEYWLDHLEQSYGRKALKEIINHHVIEQLAQENNITIEQGILDLETSFLFTLEGTLTSTQVEEKRAEWEEMIKHRLSVEELATMDVDVPEAEIQAYYDRYRNQYSFSQHIQISHIIVPDRSTADRVIEELDQGASFSALAREYTIDDETRRDGGYLGYFTASNSFLPSGYFERATALEEHEYSEPFQTGEGIGILYLHRNLPSVELTYDQVRNHIRRILALEQIHPAPNPTDFWNELNVEWIY